MGREKDKLSNFGVISTYFLRVHIYQLLGALD